MEGKNKYYEGSSSSLVFCVGPISWKGKGRKKVNIKLEREGGRRIVGETSYLFLGEVVFVR